ncbi:TPA: hypothetical protein DD449_03645 [Candidatus Berkelbacteria bacterium]|uniref:O-antigen polymerase n=1 Tax=Berkelbacteria bacterium GW2011_GWE1_39_12 TaxID=1618337 RepID=A0A0G4B413_9BACT|nr:MAG: O-antigen polymerase [Berkelbacteria bacterium GW2011_GWE1_39_12]HBO60751.1 hypothetical protein [Candidatus Berkelbacteria bacterium]
MKYLIGLIALLLPTYLIRFDIFGGIPTTLLEIVIYIIFFYGLINLGYCQMLKIKKRVWLIIGILLIAAMVSVYVSPAKSAALGQFKAYFLDPILVFWLIMCYLEPKDFRWTIYGFMGSSLAVSVYSIVQKLMHNVTVDGRVIGIFGYNPNYVALFLTPLTVLLTGYGVGLLQKKKYPMAIIAGAVVLINIIGIYLTGSRSGLLATVAGITFLLILHFWSKIKAKSYLRIGLFILIAIAILGSAYAFRPNFKASGGRVVSSNNVRWQIWQTSIEMIKDHPILGVGLGSYQNAFTDLTKDRVNFKEFISPLALSSHNVFLMFYLTTGLFGFIAFIGLLIFFYRTGFSEFKNDGSKMLLAAMTALVLQGLVDTPYFKNDLSLIFWLLFGFMLSLSRWTKEKQE